ncbi:phosphodiesterase [Breznakia pachnodae]|uniref:Phosphoesterase n=1 Tax=Breznakia pachnodae TaxID=265178 RepID=A0ABU0DXK6_9FIRM|nr:phosphodiesterase [Breznakia pachnodae]MDQ0359364.1 putative phosphoesterase [Breznakia pachnodae]
MKYLIASDIHGSAYYAKKVTDAFKEYECDYLLLLGDILYHGPRNPLPKDYNPKIVIELLNEMKDKIIACRGNCDSEVDQMVLQFPITNTSQTLIEEDYRIFLSHGHVYHPDHLPEGIRPGDVFMFGHIHIPVMEEKTGVHIINPGSVSLPKENNPHTFGVLEHDTFSLIDVEGNVIKDYFINRD